MPYFAMQGSAYLLPFYQGVVQGLADAGALGEATHLAGLSGGALTAALVAAGVSGEAQFNATTAMIKACGAAGPAGCQPLNGKLAGLLGDLLPPDAGARAGARVRVWVSALPDTNATTLAGSVPYGVSDFASTPDLTAALFASDMIPCFSDGDRAYNLVRGVPAIDGGFSSDFRELCADAAGAGGARCVTAATAVLNPAATADGGASLAACPGAVGGAYQTGPARTGVKGTVPLAAPAGPPSAWALPSTCPPGADPAAAAWPPFVPQGSTLSPPGANPDIYPGARTDAVRGWEACDWLSFALKPDFERWGSVYAAGLAEAGAWAREAGWCVEKGVEGEGAGAPAPESAPVGAAEKKRKARKEVAAAEGKKA